MSLFYPFWQQPRSSAVDSAQEPVEYPRTGRLVLPQPGDTLLIEFQPTSPRSANLLYRARLRSTGFRRLSADSLKPMAAEEPAVEEIAKPQTPVVISFVQNDVLYRFETVIAASAPFSAEATTISFTRPKFVTRIQRRHFYRVPIETATSFYGLSGDQMNELATGRILNLSAGGMLLATNREVAAGAHVIVRVPMGRDGFPTDIKAEALECAPVHGKLASFHIRLRFDNGKDFKLTEDEQEGINHYLYEQQRMMLRVRRLMRGKA
ncbi:MAG TPA: PilZ domain-containing protein [Capsulimonadaceae bacterium]|nr:PilZ domain-containing protein [Capsulimonadaceae bacterium]